MFLVLEMQSNGSAISTLSYQYATRAEADSKFHSVLSAAAISSVLYHGCLIISDDGVVLDQKFYYHESA